MVFVGFFFQNRLIFTQLNQNVQQNNNNNINFYLRENSDTLYSLMKSNS